MQSLIGLTSTMVGARYDFKKAEKKEKFFNDLSTNVGVGSTVAAGYGAHALLKNNPKKAIQLYQATDKYLFMGLEKASTFMGKVINKIKGTKVGKKVADKTYNGLRKAVKNDTVKRSLKKIMNSLEKVVNMSSAKRGKYALLGAGIALATGLVVKMIRNHDKKEGAIEQKYQDMNTLSTIL